MTPLGVTPAQLLAHVSGTQFATLTWGTASPGQDVSVYPIGTTTLTIDVTPRDGGIAYSQPVGVGSPGEHGLCGPGTLTIAATVRFVTADHGFDETWQESLFSSDGQSLLFYQDLQATPPVGTFRVTYTGTQKWDSTELTLTATFDDRGARGDVQYGTEQIVSTGPNSAGGGGLIVHAASWVPAAVGDAGVDSGSTDAPAAEAGAD